MKQYLGGILLLLLGLSKLFGAAPPGSSANHTQPFIDVQWLQTTEDRSLEDALCANLASRDPFRAGQCDFQFLIGRYQKTSWGPGGPPFGYVPLAIRYGWMLTTPCDQHGCLRGCLEALLEVNYSPVVGDIGTYVTGPSLLARYNFVQPECAVVPYVQCGAGLAFTDGWRNHQQQLIGNELEFLLRGEFGARVMLTELLSLDAEVGFQHISNGKIAVRNGGVNSVGFGLGFTYFFGKIP